MLKCKICMPHRNDITPETIEAIKNFPAEWNGIKFVGESILNSNLIKARNDLLWGNSDLGPFDNSYDYYLFWDSDVVGTIDDFELMHSLNKPVVFGLYPYAEDRGIIGMVGGKYPKGYPGCVEGKDRIRVDEKRVFEGPDYWGGFGFCLIRKNVLYEIDYPWVEPRVIDTPPEYPRGSENVFDDIGFCLKMSDAGINPVLDNRLSLSHISRGHGQSPGKLPANDIPSGIFEVKPNMDAEAMAAAGIVLQMAERIKHLSEQVMQLQSSTHEKQPKTP